MTGLRDWFFAKTEHDTAERAPSTLAAMQALEAARGACGQGWKPSQIAAGLPDDAAGSLKALLTAPEMKAMEDRQVAMCASAGRQRSRFIRWLLLAVGFSTVAAGLGGLQVYEGVSWNDGMAGAVIAGTQLVCLVIAFWYWANLWLRRPYRGWLSDRGQAGTLRRQIFETVVRSAGDTVGGDVSDASDAPNLRQMALEYFRVCLLDDQMTWFCEKAQVARTELFLIGAGRILGLLLLLAAAIVSAVAGLKQFVPEARDVLAFVPGVVDGRLSTLLTILGAAIVTAAQSGDMALLSARNRHRYHEMASTLARLRDEGLFAAQEAARLAGADEYGARDDDQRFAERVTALLAMEHAEWKAVLDHSSRQVAAQARGG